jgi:hypothetical protein
MLLDECVEYLPGEYYEGVVSPVVRCNVNEPNVPAEIADDDLKDLCCDLPVAPVVLLVTHGNPNVSVHRLFEYPRPEVAACQLSREAPDCVVGWYDFQCLEIVAYLIVPSVQSVLVPHIVAPKGPESVCMSATCLAASARPLLNVVDDVVSLISLSRTFLPHSHVRHTMMLSGTSISPPGLIPSFMIAGWRILFVFGSVATVLQRSELA